MRRLLLLVSLLVVVLPLGGVTAQQDNNPTLTLTNASPTTVCWVYIIPAGADSWGQPRLNAPLNSGQSGSVMMQAGLYHILWQDCEGATLQVSENVPLYDDRTVSYPDGVTQAATRQAGTVALTLVNRLSDAICWMYIIPDGAPDWGQNFLPQRPPIEVGGTWTGYFAAGIYHVSAQQCQTASEVRLETIDLREDTTLEVSAGGSTTADGNLNAMMTEANTLYRQGRYQEALNVYQEMERLATESEDDPLFWAMLYDSMGAIYTGLTEYDVALRYHDQALSALEGVEAPLRQASILHNIGVTYRQQGQYERALDFYTQSLTYSSGLDDQGLAMTTRNNIAGVYVETGRLTEAQPLYEDVLAYRREVDDRIGVANTLNALAYIAAASDDLEQALALTEEALEMARETGDILGQANTLLNLVLYHQADAPFVNVSRDQPMLYEALALAKMSGAVDLRQAILVQISRLTQRAASGPVESITYTEDGRMQLSITHDIMVDPVLSAEYLDDAQQALQAAVDGYEVLAMNAVTSNGTQTLRLLTSPSPPHKRLAVMQAQADDLIGALTTLERQRAIALRLELTAPDAPLNVSSDLLFTEADLRQQVQDAQQNLDALYRENASAEDIQAAATTLYDLRQRYQLHLERMQREGGYLDRQLAVDVSDLATIQGSLPPDTTLLLYALGDYADLRFRNSLVMLVTPTNIDAVLLDVTSSQVAERAAAFASDRLHNAAALQDLYAMLIAPIAERLTTSRLLISPDGPLYGVPFVALQAPDGSYLIDHYAISTITSGTTFVLLHQRAQAADPCPTCAALVLAQPSAPGLPRLENARREALEVAALLGVEANLNASESDLRAGSGAASLLHLAAHATLDPFAPYFSVIHLAAGADDDGRLETREVYNLDLAHTQLVILSGCETGVGGAGAEYGLFNRAFLVAGADRVLSSLWAVDDAATATLVADFVSAWQSSPNAADALQQAILATRNRYPEPVYWAAFSLTGLP